MSTNFFHISSFFSNPEEEGGINPSLLSYRTKQLDLFVLERELHSKTEGTNTIDAGYVCIVCVESDFRRIFVGVEIWVGILLDINAASSPEVEGIDIEAQLA